MARKNFIPRAAGIAFAVSLSLATPAQARAQAEAQEHQAPLEMALPDDTTPVENFAIALDRYLRMTVPVTIAGAGPFRFLIDTGAQATVITKRVTTGCNSSPRGRQCWSQWAAAAWSRRSSSTGWNSPTGGSTG